MGLKIEGDVDHRSIRREGRSRAKGGGSKNKSTKHESHWCFLLTGKDTSDSSRDLSLNSRLIIVKFAWTVLTLLPLFDSRNSWSASGGFLTEIVFSNRNEKYE
jgi:hypothetical protein